MPTIFRKDRVDARTWWPLALALLALAIAFAVSGRLRPVRVGDGAEYYAMFFAWRDTWRPFMTDASWLHYKQFFDTGVVVGLVDAKALREAFPALVLGQTADFNHFWLYSFVPALFSRIGALVGLRLGPHGSFLVYHFLLGALVLVAAWRHFGRQGLVSAVLLLAASPAAWYLNKVHTEWFTVCLTSCAVICLMRERLLPSALCLALASTQNISFAGIAGVAVLLDLIRRKGEERYSLPEAVMLVATVLLVLLHPAYYFFRFGVLTPQLLAGGASIGANVSTAYLWFFDPDVGLLPNWPFIVLIAIVAVSVRWTAPGAEPRSSGRALVIVVVAYLVISLFAQSSTQNLNSAASPGPSRYGLWYIALFFPLLVRVMQWAGNVRSPGAAPSASPQPRRQSPTGPLKLALVAAMVVFGLVYSAVFYRPTLSEIASYRPSWSSEIVQRWMPGLYDPPAEIFMERFGYVGEDPGLLTARAVVGPDCRKMLVRKAAAPVMYGGLGCGFSADRVGAILDARGDGSPPDYRYVHLTPAEMANARFPVQSDVWYRTGAGGEGRFALGAGWGLAEPWGVWSEGEEAELAIPCPPNSPVRELDLAISGFVTPAHKRVDLGFYLRRTLLQQSSFGVEDAAPKTLTIPLPPDACRDGMLNVRILIDKPTSPVALGISTDPRNLGIGLLQFRLH